MFWCIPEDDYKPKLRIWKNLSPAAALIALPAMPGSPRLQMMMSSGGKLPKNGG
jgi:hypothetical protein